MFKTILFAQRQEIRCIYNHITSRPCMASWKIHSTVKFFIHIRTSQDAEKKKKNPLGRNLLLLKRWTKAFFGYINKFCAGLRVVHPTHLFNTVNGLPLSKNAKEKKHSVPLSYTELSWLIIIINKKSYMRHLTSLLHQ